LKKPQNFFLIFYKVIISSSSALATAWQRVDALSFLIVFNTWNFAALSLILRMADISQLVFPDFTHLSTSISLAESGKEMPVSFKIVFFLETRIIT